ncbi:S1C family serine protease [Methylomonas rivi]|uniref:Serine protease n=1 Tax=Methylomonas rivi TaxID=2952226 RepID=A0ABT1U710_9GAMM|nr:serine protease [Methylomonas sp. WSC-6]MCQ8129170.1 serine protease [Methylomonas sp. WSC-6]
MLQRIKPAIVAVGTVMPTRNPRAVFLGTGFAIADGRQIITNAHVVGKELDAAHLEQFAVFFRQDEREHMLIADLTAIDQEHDLAILRLQDGKLPALEIGDSGRVKEGQLFAFTGYPIGMVLGLYPVTHRSIISAISPNAIPVIASRQLNVKMIKKLATPYEVFQLDATAYPGNSGSPLYDIDSGKVVGIINKVFVQGSKENALSNPSGISYAIPSEHIKQLLNQKSIQ